MARSGRTKPIGRDEDTSIDTDGQAFEIPWSEGSVSLIRIKTSADAYVGLGVDSVAPAPAVDNTVHHWSGVYDYYLDGVRQTDGLYVYIYAQASTVDADISYLG